MYNYIKSEQKKKSLTKDVDEHRQCYRALQLPLRCNACHPRWRTISLTEVAAPVTDQEDSYIPFVILNCTFPAPTRPKIPKSSPFLTERLIPSRVASDPSFNHEKSASLIDNTWRRWLEVAHFLQTKTNTNLIAEL